MEDGEIWEESDHYDKGKKKIYGYISFSFAHSCLSANYVYDIHWFLGFVGWDAHNGVSSGLFFFF